MTHGRLIQRLRKSDFILESKMAELNQNKNQNNQLQVIFDWKHSSIFKQATFHKCSTELLYQKYGKISQESCSC